MKLISCHIENYGKISDRNYSFDERLTECCEDNGYGKSTLASFLKAMFYGLEADRRNIREFIERRHFYPFAGGSFGGHVTFELRGDTYKIERYFDEKRDVLDTLSVYRNGVLWEAPAGSLGEWAFGIDRQSFERTVFLTGEDLEIASTGSINSKLNSFVEGSQEIGLEEALARIDRTVKIYKKSKQGNDLITKATERINRLSTELTNAEQIAEGLREKYARYNECGEQISRLSGEIARAQNENVVRTYWEQYDGIAEEIKSARARIEEIKSLYPKGVPSAEDIAGAKRALEEKRRLEELSARRVFTDGEEREFSALSKRFAARLPEPQELKECGARIEEFTALSNEISPKNAAKPTERQLALISKFEQRPLDGELSDRLDGLYEEYAKVERDCAELSAPVEAVPNGRGGRHKLSYIVAAIVCAAAVAAGVIILFFSAVAGAILLALGGIGLVCDGFMYLNKKTAAAHAVAAEPAERTEAAMRLDRVRQELHSVLLPYGYAPEKGIDYSVAQLKDEWREYCALRLTIEENERELGIKRAQYDKFKGELDGFFRSYGAEGGAFVDMLADLKADVGVYRRLCERKTAAEKERTRVALEAERASADISRFLDKYGLKGEEEIALADRRVASLAAAQDMQKRQTERAERLVREKGLTERPEGGLVDLNELNRRLTEAQDRRNRLFSDISEDEEIAERTGELKEAQAEEKGRLESYRARHRILCAAEELLKAADKRLKDRYVKPVLEKFRYYSSLLERAIGEEVVMDSEFEIRFEKNGRERSEKHLSSGQRSICVFCFRMALIGNMYPEEKPFLIMDDPFVNLDGIHLEKIKEVLRELSTDFQIIYFTCHESRSLGL